QAPTTTGDAASPDTTLDVGPDVDRLTPPSLPSPAQGVDAQDDVDAVSPQSRPRRWPRVLAFGLAALALLAAGGAWGYQAYLQQQASTLVQSAATDLRRGDDVDVAKAQSELRQVIAQGNPTEDALAWWLLAEVQRWWAGAQKAPALTAWRTQARQHGALPEIQQAAQGLQHYLDGHQNKAAGRVQQLKQRATHATALYIAGRIAQLLAMPEARSLFMRALERDNLFLPARIALLEMAVAEGAPAAALGQLRSTLRQVPNHRRARLWQLVLWAQRDWPDPAPATLKRIRQQLGPDASPADRAVLRLVHLLHPMLPHKKGEERTLPVWPKARVPVPPIHQLRIATLAHKAPGEAALTAATTAVEQLPHHAPLARRLAELHLQRAEAHLAWPVLADLPPDEERTLPLQVQAAVQLRDAGKLRTLEQRLARLHPAPAAADVDSDRRALRWRVWIAQGRSEEIGDIDPKIEAALMRRRLGRIALAEVALHRAAAKTLYPAWRKAQPPEDDDAYSLWLATRLAAQAAPADQAKLLARASKVAAHYPPLRWLQAEAALHQGAWDSAGATLAALRRHKAFVAGRRLDLRALDAELRLRLWQGQAAQAEAHLKTHLAPEDRDTPGAQMAIARLALRRGAADQAIAALKPHAKASDDAALLTLYGEALARGDKREEALTQLRRAQSLDPTLPEAMRAIARVFLQADKARAALEPLQTLTGVLKTRPRPPTWRAEADVLLGQCHLALGKRHRDEALQAFEAAVVHDDTHVEAWYQLATLRASPKGRPPRRGRLPAAAKEAYQRFLKLAADDDDRRRQVQRLLR
ncbi:MAG: heme biosynthesis protein HemY, partial [Polyangiales bacterium]